ncbi:ethanolamine utilization protein EutP, partial [Citrobacter portucalensis]
QEPTSEPNSHNPRSVQHLVDYLTELSQKEERAGEKTHHS